MLGIDNAPSADVDRWNLDEMKLEAFSEPDPDQIHKAMGPVANLVSLTESESSPGLNNAVKSSESTIQTQSFLTKDLDKQVKFTDLSIWSFHSPADSTKSFKFVSKSID